MLFKKKPKEPINHIKAFLELPYDEKLRQLEEVNELVIIHKESLLPYSKLEETLLRVFSESRQDLRMLNYKRENGRKLTEYEKDRAEHLKNLVETYSILEEKGDNIKQNYQLSIDRLINYLSLVKEIVNLERIEASYEKHIQKFTIVMKELLNGDGNKSEIK